MAEATAPEKYGGALHGPMSVRLWLRLLSCTTVVEKRLRRGFADQYDTTLPRFDVMAALDRKPDGLAMGELSQLLLVSNGNVTGVVRQLQKDGLVKVETAPGDRRSYIVALTPVGAKQFAVLAAAHHQWVEQMLGAIPDDDKARLLELLILVKRSISDSVEGRP